MNWIAFQFVVVKVVLDNSDNYLNSAYNNSTLNSPF